MLFSILSLLFASSAALAAPLTPSVPRGCGAHKDADAIAAAESQFRTDYAGLSFADDISAVSTPPISVVWHVIQKSDDLAGGNVPDSQIQANIDAMNQHYASSGVSFQLTKTTHTTNADWFSTVGPDETNQTTMKTQLREGDAATLNIYTVGFESGSGQGLLGYATFPSDYSGNPKDDGVVILYSSLPGGTTTNYDEGKTLTHEVGHWLGLYHVFQGGCSGAGDQVDDTPPQSTATSGCPASQDSCPGGGVDSIHNYMDYSYDSCMNQFTTGQITRLKQQILTYRQISVGGGNTPTTTTPDTTTRSPPTTTTATTRGVTTTTRTRTTSAPTTQTKPSQTSNCPSWWPNCPW